MDDFLVMAESIDDCLAHLSNVLRRCEKCNLVINWERYHFMVTKIIVSSYKIYKKGIEVDKANIDVIENLPPPIFAKGIHSFFDHAYFHR